MATEKLGGSIAALNASVIANVYDCGVISVTVSGTWSGVLEFQVSNGPSPITWEPIHFASPGKGWRLADLGFNGNFVALVAGFRNFRVFAREWTSGTANITIYGTDGSYERIENHGLRRLDGVTRSVTGIDTKTFFNIYYPQTIIGLNVTAVTAGPVSAPNITIQAIDPSELDEYDLITFTGVGTMAAGAKRLYGLGPSLWGGDFDETAGFSLPRLCQVAVSWTLGGGQAVTYDLDIFQCR